MQWGFRERASPPRLLSINCRIASNHFFRGWISSAQGRIGVLHWTSICWLLVMRKWVDRESGPNTKYLSGIISTGSKHDSLWF
jgi:hypothetical protein